MDMSIQTSLRKEKSLSKIYTHMNSMCMHSISDNYLRIRSYSPSLMAAYADGTLDRISLMLNPSEKEHILVVQDESIFHTNEYRRRSWLGQDQQPIRKKGHGWVVHVSDFISETIGWIKLPDDQIADQLKFPDKQCLPAFWSAEDHLPWKRLWSVVGSCRKWARSQAPERPSERPWGPMRR